MSASSGSTDFFLGCKKTPTSDCPIKAIGATVGDRPLDAFARAAADLGLATDGVGRRSSFGGLVGVTVCCDSPRVDSSVCNMVIGVEVGTTDAVVGGDTAEGLPPTDGELLD